MRRESLVNNASVQRVAREADEAGRLADGIQPAWKRRGSLAIRPIQNVRAHAALRSASRLSLSAVHIRLLSSDSCSMDRASRSIASTGCPPPLNTKKLRSNDRWIVSMIKPSSPTDDFVSASMCSRNSSLTGAFQSLSSNSLLVKLVSSRRNNERIAANSDFDDVVHLTGSPFISTVSYSSVVATAVRALGFRPALAAAIPATTSACCSFGAAATFRSADWLSSIPAARAASLASGAMAAILMERCASFLSTPISRAAALTPELGTPLAFHAAHRPFCLNLRRNGLAFRQRDPLRHLFRSFKGRQVGAV